MNHKSWKRSLESSLTAVVSKQPRFADAQEIQPPVNDRRLPVAAGATETHQKNIVLPPMRMDSKTSVLVSVEYPKCGIGKHRIRSSLVLPDSCCTKLCVACGNNRARFKGQLVNWWGF